MSCCNANESTLKLIQLRIQTMFTTKIFFIQQSSFGFNIGIKGLSSIENVKHLYFDSLGDFGAKKFKNSIIIHWIHFSVKKNPYRGCKIIELAKVWNDCVHVVPPRMKHDSFEKFVIFRLNRLKRYVSNSCAAL